MGEACGHEGPVFAAVRDPNWEKLAAVLDANRGRPEFNRWLNAEHNLYEGTKRLEPHVSPIDAAVVLGYPQHVRILASEGATPTRGFPEGWRLREGIAPAMHLALPRGTPALIDALVDAGASPNDRDEYGATPLYRLMIGDIDAQKIRLAVAFIEAGATCELGLCANHEALYFAVIAALSDDAIADTINALRTCGARWTHRGAIAPIAVAAKHGNRKIVSDLIARGAQVDAGTEGETALKIAAEKLDTTIVKTLLDAGAHPNRGRAVLVCMLDQKHLQRSPGAARDIHDTETRAKMEDIAAMLIGAGADVNAARPSRWGHGTTAIHIAASNGLANIVKMLLAAGANPQRTCRQAWSAESSPLTLACNSPWANVDVIRTLVEYGAQTTATPNTIPKNDNGTTVYTDIGYFVAWYTGPDAPRHLAEADKRTIIALLGAAYPGTDNILSRPMAEHNADGEYTGDAMQLVQDGHGHTLEYEKTPAAIALAAGDMDLAHWIDNGNAFAKLEHTGMLAPLLAAAPIAFAPLHAARRGNPRDSPLAAKAARPWGPSRHRLFCTAHRSMVCAALTALVYRCNMPNVVAFLIIALVGRDAYVLPIAP